MMEEWRPVVGGAGYEVSSLGRVRKVITGQLMTSRPNSKGYLRARAGARERTVHTLVLEAFAGPRPEGHQAAHLDGNRTHNVRDNLAWVTASENEAHKVLHGTKAAGERQGNSKITWEQVREIRTLAAIGLSYRLIGNRFGIGKRTVADIVVGISWKEPAALRAVRGE